MVMKNAEDLFVNMTLADIRPEQRVSRQQGFTDFIDNR